MLTNVCVCEIFQSGSIKLLLQFIYKSLFYTGKQRKMNVLISPNLKMSYEKESPTKYFIRDS